MSASPLLDDAQRSAIMRRLASSVPLTALAFAVMAPLLGMLIAWCVPPALFTVIDTASAGNDAIISGLLASLATAYSVGAIPAAIAGVWVALLSPFAAPKRFYAGAAAIGAASTWLFLIAAVPADKSPGAPILLALAGAAASVLCALIIRAWPESRGARRDRLARERAQRLAKARAA